eukprot:5062263-Lingulodinium_polyedra.AAC.1
MEASRGSMSWTGARGRVFQHNADVPCTRRGGSGNYTHFGTLAVDFVICALAVHDPCVGACDFVQS